MEFFKSYVILTTIFTICGFCMQNSKAEAIVHSILCVPLLLNFLFRWNIEVLTTILWMYGLVGVVHFIGITVWSVATLRDVTKAMRSLPDSMTEEQYGLFYKLTCKLPDIFSVDYRIVSSPTAPLNGIAHVRTDVSMSFSMEKFFYMMGRSLFLWLTLNLVFAVQEVNKRLSSLLTNMVKTTVD